jgi:hypothetical protein
MMITSRHSGRAQRDPESASATALKKADSGLIAGEAGDAPE